jgi:pentatricopeptide repeat protein
MESLYLAGVIQAKPNNVTYNAVISAYSRGRRGIASAEKAEKLL